MKTTAILLFLILIVSGILLQAKFKEIEETNAVLQAQVTALQNKSPEPEMIAIKGGCFLMGSPQDEKERREDENQHKVCVKDFYMGKTEVTKGQFNAFVTATHYPTDAEKAHGCIVGQGIIDKKYNWRNVDYSQTELHPVVCVSWNDAIAYINWLNKETGKNYRLPTEAEWEYAARAGTKTPFYTGECINADQANFTDDVDYNNCRGNPFAGSIFHKHHAVQVGSYPPNHWGLLDMAGNVLEWTCSEYERDYSGKENQCTSNNDVNASLVMRGGYWFSIQHNMRVAFRFQGASNKVGASSTVVGFRLARIN